MAYFPPALSGFERSRIFVFPSGDTTGLNDATRINAALAKNGRVELGPGDFYHTGLAIGQSHTHLFGQGPRLTRLNFVGDHTTKNELELTAGMTAAQNGTGPAPSGGPLFDCSVQRMGLIGGGTFNSGLGETVGMGLIARGTQECLFRDLYLTGQPKFGVYVETGDQNGGSEANVSKRNTAEDILIDQTGDLGFYDDSINGFVTQLRPNRDNVFRRCTTRRTAKYATTLIASGFQAFGTLGTKFEDCHAEGFQNVDAFGTLSGFVIGGSPTAATWGCILHGCRTVENYRGIFLNAAYGTKIIGHVSWFDANYGLIDGGSKDTLIEGGEILDTGVAAVYAGVGIYISPGITGGAAQANRSVIRGVKFALTGQALSPVYRLGPNAVDPLKFDSGSEANIFTDILVDGCRQTGWSGAPIPAWTVGTLKHNVILRANYGINPFGIIANPFDNGNAYVTPLSGAAATPTSTTVYTCVIVPLDIFWTGGTVTAQTRNGTAIPQVAASPNFVHLEPGDTYSITFSVVPTTFRVYGH